MFIVIGSQKAGITEYRLTLAHVVILHCQVINCRLSTDHDSPKNSHFWAQTAARRPVRVNPHRMLMTFIITVPELNCGAIHKASLLTLVTRPE